MTQLSKYKFHPRNFFLYEDQDDGITRWLKSISLLSAIIALIVFTDYFLPLKQENFIVKDLVVRTGFDDITYAVFDEANIRTGEEEFWLILDGEDVAVSEQDLIHQDFGDTILICKTAIFGINVKLQNKKFYPSEFFYPYINVYGMLILFPITFLVIFALTLIFKRKTEFILTLGVINIILLVGFGSLLLFY